MVTAKRLFRTITASMALYILVVIPLISQPSLSELVCIHKLSFFINSHNRCYHSVQVTVRHCRPRWQTQSPRKQILAYAPPPHTTSPKDALKMHWFPYGTRFYVLSFQRDAKLLLVSSKLLRGQENDRQPAVRASIRS